MTAISPPSREGMDVTRKSENFKYYQVTLTMLASETREREFRPLRGIEDNWKKTILTMDDFGLGFEDGVEIINLIDWLLGKA